MDVATLTKQMKALKKKARDARTAGKDVLAREFQNGASRMWRKVRKLVPKVAKKAEA